MTNNNSHTISRTVSGWNRKGNQGRTVAGNKVLSTMLQLGVPRITFRKLREAGRFKTIAEVCNCVKNGRVCIDEFQKGLCVIFCVYFRSSAGILLGNARASGCGLWCRDYGSDSKICKGLHV